MNEPVFEVSVLKRIICFGNIVIKKGYRYKIMLSDRNYMGNPIRNSNNRAAGGIKAVFVLIAINVVAFFLVPQGSPIQLKLGLSTDGIKDLMLWQPITSLFIHGGLMHLLLNMWGLYLFGTIVAPFMGGGRFLTLYFLSGLCGSGFWLLFNWDSFGLLIGASGAVFGVMMATAMLFPDQRFLLLFFPVPIKTKTLILVYAAIEIVSELGVRDNIAHLAHLGGFIAAYFYIKILYKNQVWDMFGFLWKSGGRSSRPKTPPKGWDVRSYDSQSFRSSGDNKSTNKPIEPNAPVTQKELDRILDKISEHTINSLSEEERNTLKRAREQMKNGR
jgi:membrane associated rhomboid family serine protease